MIGKQIQLGSPVVQAFPNLGRRKGNPGFFKQAY
jgi:hypothetical protein